MIYNYVVFYKASNGFGRCFIDTETKINTRKRIEEVEESISISTGIKDLIMTNYIELEPTKC